jgi:hypothetical protein
MMRADDLLAYLVGAADHILVPALSRWLTERRFADFAEAQRDKIRKKIRDRADPEALADLRGELAVAAWLLQNPRITLAYERYAHEKQRAPDYSATLGAGLRFDTEVSRLRGTTSADQAHRIASTLCDKIGQLRPGLVNVVALVCDDGEPTTMLIEHAQRLLMDRAASSDMGYFARRGYSNLRDFHRDYRRLSAVAILHVTTDGATSQLGLWHNRQARHALPPELTQLLSR